MYESQAGLKINGRNINNLRYADDTTLMAESKEELKSLLIRVNEESEKAGLRLSIREIRSWHPVPSLHGKLKRKSGTVTDFIFLGSKNTPDSDYSHEIKRLAPWKESYDKLDTLLKSRTSLCQRRFV